MSQGTYEEFLKEIAKRESRNRYNSVNNQGFIGKYQMGESALIDAGYYQKASGNYNQDWTGQFTGVDGVYSKSDFLNNPKAQENAMFKYKKCQWRYMMDAGLDRYFGTTINGILMTPAAYLAGAHLCGHGAVIRYVLSGGKIVDKDGYGTSIETYMREINNYDVTPITGKYQKERNYNKSFYDQHTKERYKYDYILNPTQKYIQKPKVFIDNELTLPDVPRYSDSNGNVIYSQRDVNNFSNDELEKITNPRKRILHEYELKDLLKVDNTDYIRAYLTTVYNNPQKYTRPQLNAMVKSGELIYVQSYRRSNGTVVEGYYRRYPNSK